MMVRPSGEITPADSMFTPAGGVSTKRTAGGSAVDGFQAMPTIALVVNNSATATAAAISADLGTRPIKRREGGASAGATGTVGDSCFPFGRLLTSTSSRYPRLGIVRM